MVKAKISGMKIREWALGIANKIEGTQREHWHAIGYFKHLKAFQRILVQHGLKHGCFLGQIVLK